jgi:undecaprenyl diphosphate synthase
MNKKKIPHTVGIIMDGNRRYARESEIPALEGHRAGFQKFREVVEWSKEAGIRELIVYAFSTENWKRTTEEVGYLMNLFRHGIEPMVKDALLGGVRIIFIGSRTQLENDIVKALEQAEEKTRNGNVLTLAIALSYGGRSEILDAIHRIPEAKRESITEEEFGKLLWTGGLHDPDLVIRTGGDVRLSNFLPWQSVYSELVFSPSYWPDFSKEEFLGILEEFAKRERRLGK